MAEELPVIHSIVRVNPLEYEPEDVILRSEIGEVELFDPSDGNHFTETWIVDELAERNDRENRQDVLFSSQGDIYGSFTHWLDESVFIKADALTCLLVGGRGSGKSYTLFGSDNVEERGILPRYVSSLYAVDTSAPKEKGTAYHFNSKLQHLMISMFIVHGDQMIDLLDPPKEYPIEGNLGFFDTFGATPLPIKNCQSDNETHTLELLHLGILSASIYALNSEFLFNSVDIYVCFKLFYPNKVQTVNFVEISSLLFLYSNAIEPTFFPHECPELRSAEAFAQCGLFGPLAVNKDKKVHKKNGYQASFLTYMLQDALLLNGYRPDSTYLTSTLVIACLNGSADCFSDNKVTLDLLQSMSEKFRAVLSKYKAKPPDLSKYRQRLTHRISLLKLSDELVSSRTLLEKVQKVKIPIIQKGDKMHTPRAEKLVKYEKRKKQLKVEFYEKKISFLTRILEQLGQKTMKKKEKRHDLRVIKSFLRSRGLFGLIIQDEPNFDDPDYKIQLLMAGMSLDEDDDGNETVDYPNTPWSTDGVPMNEAYFMPITQCNFASKYLFLSIPSGHLAICKSPLRSYVENSETGELEPDSNTVVSGFHFEGIKHCKVLPIDGILINDQHCVIFRLGTSVKIRPLQCEEEDEVSFVEVNGVAIDEETILQDRDVIRIGSCTTFVLCIPAESDTESRKTLSRKSSSNFDALSEFGEDSEGEELTRIITVPLDMVMSGNYDPCLCASMQSFLLKVLSDSISNSLMKAHATVDRELVDIIHEQDMTDEMLITSYIPSIQELADCCSTMTTVHKAILSEAILGVLHANHWAVKMKRDMHFTVHLRKKYCHDRKVARQYRGMQDGVVVNGELFEIKILAECLFRGQRSSRGDSWWWSFTFFMQRLFHMRKMYNDFVWKFAKDVDLLDERYPISENPFLQTVEPELIGVSNIHLDNMFYLFDTRQTVPVISFKGNKVGQLSFKLRCWIDKVEALPEYLKLDYNAKFSDFMGRTCVMRFYFESLSDISPNTSNNIQIAHSFFCHSGQYKTARLPARDQIKGDTIAYIDNANMITQVITKDFIKYSTKRSIELEIWGCRIGIGNGENPESDHPLYDAEHKVGELSAVKNLKLPVSAAAVFVCLFPLILLEQDLGPNAQGKLEAFQRIKDELKEVCEDTDEDEEDDVFMDDLVSVDSMTVTDNSDPAELQKQLKEVSAQLIEAEKAHKRAARTADTYKMQVSKLNPTGQTAKRKFSTITNVKVGTVQEKGLNKDLQIALMEKELLELRDGVKNKESKACVIA